jgi:hypothetical protein
MDAALRDFLKQRHAFDTWSKEGASAVDFPRLELVLDGSELEGWQLHRSQRSKAAETVVIQSLWTRSEDELLAVDIQACTSRAAAHDALLEWLGEFQSPLIARQSPAPAGDVAFAMPGNTAILFARGNLAVQVRNAGPRVQALAQLAATFEQALIRKRRQ